MSGPEEALVQQVTFNSVMLESKHAKVTWELGQLLKNTSSNAPF